MASSGLLNDVKKNPWILFSAIALHFFLIILLGLNLNSSDVPELASSNKKTVKAFVVDNTKIEAEAKKRKQAKEVIKKQALAEKEKEKVKQQLLAEEKRLAWLKKKQTAEKKRLADLNKKKVEAEKKKVEAEKKKKKKALEEKRKQEEAQRRKDDAAELQRSLAEEDRLQAQAKENNAKLQSLRSRYVSLIEQKVERNWLRPVTTNSSMSCEVVVRQTSLGDVIDVSLKKCVNDLAFQRSIERAVWKASPLPPPPSPEVFDREIHFTFRPHN